MTHRSYGVSVGTHAFLWSCGLWRPSYEVSRKRGLSRSEPTRSFVRRDDQKT